MRGADSDFEMQWFSEWLSEPTVYGPATSELNRLLVEEPEEAWALIRRLVAHAETSVALECVAAGPLEDLLCEHGLQFIDRVEAAAHHDPRFKQALGTVWGHNRMRQDVRARVSAVVGSPGRVS